jgi:hypothetical protein
VFVNRVMSRIYGPKREEVARNWRRLYHDKLRNLYASPNVVMVMKSRCMRWAGHVVRM